MTRAKSTSEVKKNNKKLNKKHSVLVTVLVLKFSTLTSSLIGNNKYSETVL